MNTPFFVNDLLEQKYQVFSEKKKGYKCLIDQIDIQSVFRLGKKLLSRILTYTHITLITPPLRDCRKNNFCYLCVVACKSTDRVYTAFRLSENGRVTHPQSTDWVYTAFHLLKNMDELLTHSRRIRVIHISTLFVCL